jgi:hypothetical protein
VRATTGGTLRIRVDSAVITSNGAIRCSRRGSSTRSPWQSVRLCFAVLTVRAVWDKLERWEEEEEEGRLDFIGAPDRTSGARALLPLSLSFRSLSQPLQELPQRLKALLVRLGAPFGSARIATCFLSMGKCVLDRYPFVLRLDPVLQMLRLLCSTQVSKTRPTSDCLLCSLETVFPFKFSLVGLLLHLSLSSSLSWRQ